MRPVSADVPDLELNDGNTRPQLGLGVFRVPSADTDHVVRSAFDAGYRAIDTAAMYGNEAGVGAAVRSSGLDRRSLFVTTKLWNDDHGHDRALRAFERSLARLGLDDVDLYLIHWPMPGLGLYVETWRALIELRASGRARSIGVSNFDVDELEHLIRETGVVPAVNQIELNPLHPQRRLRAFHEAHGIVTEAWSPIARGAVLADPAVSGIATRLGRTPAQVVLRWHIQLGNVVIPKSASPSRIRENARIFDFELDPDDMRAVDGVGR